MKKLLLLGGVAALLLVVGPMLVASAQDGGAKHAKGAAGAEAGKDRAPPAPIVLTPEQEGKMKDEIAAFDDAIGKLLAKANEVLGPDVAPKYVLQTAFKAIRPAGREGGKGGAREGKRGKDPK
jgi:hypothetical protein